MALKIPPFVLRHPRLFQVLAVLLAIPLIVLLVISMSYQFRAWRYPLDKVVELRQRTMVLDRAGEPIGHVFGHGENRLVVDLDEVSPHFIDALLAREDERFYWHDGVDYLGVIRAARRNYQEGRAVQGASTLTMQLARNSFGLSEKTLDRKLLEVAITRRIEARFSKKEILEFYVNRIYFGSGLYGIERASQGYLMKPAADLTLGEAAMLAGIIRGPSRFSPFRSLEGAKAQQRDVLARMRVARKISAEEQEAAQESEIVLRPVDQRMASPGYVIQKVYEDLDGFLAEEQISQGGLRIHTTIDSRLQAAAQESLQEHLSSIENRDGFPHPVMEPGIEEERVRETPYLQGAVVALENATGGVLALVGGRDYDDSPFNRAYYARRQVGSTFKPFIYAQAFSTGLKPGTLVSDGPIDLPAGGGRRWRPSNSDGKFGGPTPAAVGLIRSRNTMTVRVGQISGLESNLRLAQNVGFTAELPRSPVSYLGAFESDPLSVTSAYSVFANFGVKRAPYLIERIESTDGKLLFRHEPVQGLVMRPSAAWMTTEVLEQVVNSGTGRKARDLGYEAPCYGKTGTTNDYRDAWFAGFSDKITCGVWVGMDRPKTIMSRGYGSTLALPIWTGVMKRAEETEEFVAEPLRPPFKVVATSLCRECGLSAGSRSLDPYTHPIPEDMVPPRRCSGHFGAFTARRPSTDNPIRSLGRFLFGRKRR